MEQQMQWKRLLSDKRFGMESYHDASKHKRTDFQRDYDRLIFSAPFRRLQNKTQVFPLPGSVFVHNRLTHSLEVACVGRSLGDRIGEELFLKYKSEETVFHQLGSVVSAACLAHDLGNPPFGHSGESAITGYFADGNGQALITKLQEEGACYSDFLHFEGNANAFRLLTHRFKGRREGGFVMTYATLASIIKYPYSSLLCGKKGKFGFFESESAGYLKIADELGIIKVSDSPLKAVRYPLVYLVEAADDICYQIMDIEDAHKLRIISTPECMQLFLDFFEEKKKDRMIRIMGLVDDVNEKIAYLRSCVIGLLIDECCNVFLAGEDKILNGLFEGALIKHIEERAKKAYDQCSRLAIDRIYRSRDVLDIELAGYRIIHFLMDYLLDAVTNPEKSYSKLIIDRIPEQYETDAPDTYTRIQAVLDYISGMTDIYALELYRKMTGMNLPTL